jgi:hypothetical protein
MTIKELREKLSKFDDKTQVVVYTEDEVGLHLFEIDDVSMARGTPSRLQDGTAAFTADNTGPASWLLISVSPA